MLSPATSPATIGRARELAALRAAHEATLGGRPAGVVIAGEAGIGKTRLLQDFVAGLDAVAVARGQCVAMGSLATPFAPLRGLLRDLVARFGASAVLEAAGPAGKLLPAVLPELAEGDAGEISQEQLHDAVSLLLERLSADVPLVAIVEDVHWADVPTLDLLRSLLRTLRQGRVLMVLSYRTDDVGRGHPLQPVLVELDRAREVRRIDVRRLTADEVIEQVRWIRGDLPEPEAVAALIERSDGIPFFIEELLALETEPGDPLPTTLRELVLARYSRLSEPTQALVRLIAAGGASVDHELVSHVHAGDPDGFDAAVREAMAANVLTADGTAYGFRHALTHEAVHDELLPGERSRFHARYATTLEESDDRAGRSAEIAHHWLEAHDQLRALPALVGAARQALAAGAPASAARLGERALELWPHVPGAEGLTGARRSQLFLEVASAYDQAGDARALAVLDEALAEIGDDDPRGRALLLHEAMIVRHGNGKPGGLELCKQALELLPEDDDAEGQAIRARVLCGLGIISAAHHEPGSRATLEEAVRYARAVLASTDDEAITARVRFELIRALTNLATSSALEGDVDEAFAAFGEALALSGGEPNARLRHDEQAGWLLAMLGRFHEAISVADAAVEFSRRFGMERGWGATIAAIGARSQLALGDLDAAAATVRHVRSLHSSPIYEAYVAGVEIDLLLLRGDVEGAARTAREWRGAIEDASRGEPEDALELGRSLAQLAIAQGDLDTAWAHASLLWAGAPLLPGPALWMAVLGAEVLDLLRRADRRPSGLEHAEAEGLLRTAFDAVAVWDVADHWRSVLDAHLAATDADAWLRAVVATESGRLPVRVRLTALLRSAESQLLAGDRTAAESTASTAAALADELCLTGPAGEIAAFAARAGFAPSAAGRGGTVAGRIELTPRERQVLELVAAGLTNRQIGERLFISDKTASVHVSAILRKLGASGRAEAAARAADLLV
jgi:DNA-binding NarL/FixJ family response regulator/tetratricopeptide (TPR) repeat protein